MTTSTDFINGVNTTSLRIVVSLLLASTLVIAALLAAALGRPLPSEVFNSLGLFIMGMMTVDAAVFTAKRFSDVGYATAKTPVPAGVTVEAPSTVKVQTGVQSAVQAPGAKP